MGGGSGGLGVSWFAGVRVSAGDAGEGDFEAEVAELADVVADLPADLAAALVVVRAEIFIPGAGVRKQGVVDLQLGVSDSDQVLAATLSAHDSAWLGVRDPACLGEQLAWGQRPAGTDAWRVTAHAWPARGKPGTAIAGREQD